MIHPGEAAGESRAGADAFNSLRKALQALQRRTDPADDEIVTLVTRGLEEPQEVLDARARLRALVLEFLTVSQAHEEEQWALRRRARDEIAAG